MVTWTNAQLLNSRQFIDYHILNLIINLKFTSLWKVVKVTSIFSLNQCGLLVYLTSSSKWNSRSTIPLWLVKNIFLQKNSICPSLVVIWSDKCKKVPNTFLYLALDQPWLRSSYMIISTRDVTHTISIHRLMHQIRSRDKKTSNYHIHLRICSIFFKSCSTERSRHAMQME